LVHAWSAVILVAANGFWFCMSRCAMLPIFELTFTLLGLWMLSRRHYVPCGIALGLAAACRWNALFALLIALVWALARGDDAASGWVERVKNCLRLGTAAALAYVAGWLPETGLHPLRFIQAQLFIMHFHRFCSGNPAINARWYQWLYKTTPENGLYHMLANPVITIAGILAALVLLRRGNLVGIAGPVFLLQWAVTPRPFNYYYYYFDALTMFSLAAAIVGTRHSFRIAGRQVRLITPIAAVAVFWFVAHYASFLGLQSPYDTLFQLWP
jgi:predicted membrane-bound dolichyl-phosphate-mannose-protein mannosyltransferase